VYLGGLQPPGPASVHLGSRGETGAILREGPVPVIEVRAGIVIGAGSAAFEVIRDLVFHLPVVVTPRWVSSRSQPIALDDLLAYLLQLPQHDTAAGQVYDVGGPEVLTYAELIRGFGLLVGRRPLIVPVPALTPRLSSYGLGLVTAVPSAVGRALVEGLAFDVLADDAPIRALVPRRLKTYREAVEAVLHGERAAPRRPRWVEGSMLFRRQRHDHAFYAKRAHARARARASPEAVWGTIERLGGEGGFYFLDPLWRARGRLDALVGGVGLRRGRRDPDRLAVGDTVDFWRVVELERGVRLTLLAELRLPGSAAMEIRVQPGPGRRCTIDLTVYFHPAGAAGIAYWNALVPAHGVLFDGMAQAIARRAERAEAGARAGPDPRSGGPRP
jgi:hypothetical protein